METFLHSCFLNSLFFDRKERERDKNTVLLSFFFHIWFDVCLRGRVLLRCTLFAVVNAGWTTNNQRLLVLEPQRIKSYWKSSAASNSSRIFLERDPCPRRATNGCDRTVRYSSHLPAITVIRFPNFWAKDCDDLQKKLLHNSQIL